jgi:hypothetical protein
MLNPFQQFHSCEFTSFIVWMKAHQKNVVNSFISIKGCTTEEDKKWLKTGCLKIQYYFFKSYIEWMVLWGNKKFWIFKYFLTCLVYVQYLLHLN